MLTLLKKHFGYNSFRPLQQQVISSVLAGRDALVLMPTGGGKSLCYQLPALMLPGITLVISPLIALMKDQVDLLKANGVEAAFLNSSLSNEEELDVKEKLSLGTTKILYCAPERLGMSDFKKWLKSLQISLIAIDEAHCISEWGHDFRPEYRKLKSLRTEFVGVPIIALTATATSTVRDDIIDQLRFKNADVVVSSFNRPNLSYMVKPKQKTFEQLIKILPQFKDEPTIIYCFSRKETKKIADKLRKKGYTAAPYHAGLAASTRSKTQEQFMKDKVSIIVATVAFGMGINKPDVRLVVHYSIPKSVEGYYQETGRAGRDGLASLCVLFYSYADKIKQDYFIRQASDDAVRETAEKNLATIVEYATSQKCRRKFLLNYFGENLSDGNCGGCDSCGIKTKHILEARTAGSIKSKKTAPDEEADYDVILYEKLRAFRKKVAERLEVPPFVVFSNVSLQEMATTFPTTLESFAQISGVGKGKLAKFGETFVRHILAYTQEKKNVSH